MNSQYVLMTTIGELTQWWFDTKCEGNIKQHIEKLLIALGVYDYAVVVYPKLDTTQKINVMVQITSGSQFIHVPVMVKYE